MIDADNLVLPSVLQGITTTTEALELTMTSEMQLGSLIRNLAASALGGRVLHVGAGSGVLTAWLLDGMADESELVAVEADAELAGVLRRFLGRDSRLTIQQGSVREVLSAPSVAGGGFGLAVVSAAAALEGALDEVLALIAQDGMAVFAGLSETPDWGAADRAAAETIQSRLQLRSDLHLTALDWSSGIMLASRRRGTEA